MRISLVHHFPEFDVKYIELSKVDQSQVYADVRIGNSGLKFLFSGGDIIDLKKNVWAEFRNNNLPVAIS